MKPFLARLGVVLLVLAAPVGVYLLPEESPYPEMWDSRVLDEVRFVEQARGLTFEHPVEVSFLAEEEFNEHVDVEAAATQEEEADDERAVGMLRALGLVDRDFDLREATDELLETSLLGLYVPEEQTLYVRGEELTPAVRSTLVHELTHALQDQHFDLEHLFEEAPDGAELGVRGLVEGDAQRVENRFRGQLTPAEQQELAREQQEAQERAEDAEVPAVLEHISQAPYVFGPWLLTVLAEDGNEAVDRAFEKPPVSELQLVDPVRHGSDFEPADVEAPSAPDGAEDVDDPAAFGQLSLFEVLGARLGHARAWAAVQGWTGDSYITYTQDDKTCVASAFRMADPAAASRLSGALETWDEGDRAEIAEEDATVTLRACDPGQEATVEPVEPDAFEVLGSRVQLAQFLAQQQQAPVEVADCIAKDVVRRLGDAPFAEATAGNPEDQALVNRAFQASVLACRT